MATQARLKFKGDMRWELEHKLCTKLGFRIQTRMSKEYIVVEKLKKTFKPEVLVNGELPEAIQNELIQRCNTVVNHFREPENNLHIIRTRLHNISQTLPPLQRQYVNEWVERNVKEDQ